MPLKVKTADVHLPYHPLRDECLQKYAWNDTRREKVTFTLLFQNIYKFSYYNRKGMNVLFHYCVKIKI